MRPPTIVTSPDTVLTDKRPSTEAASTVPETVWTRSEPHDRLTVTSPETVSTLASRNPENMTAPPTVLATTAAVLGATTRTSARRVHRRAPPKAPMNEPTRPSTASTPPGPGWRMVNAPLHWCTLTGGPSTLVTRTRAGPSAAATVMDPSGI